MDLDPVLRYTGSQEARYYEGLRVERDGRICTRPRLTRRELEWLNEIGADTMLWDGTSGRCGVPFDIVSTPSTTFSGSNNSTGFANSNIATSVLPQTPHKRIGQRIKALTPRSRSRSAPPKCFRLLPVPITIARARELLATLSKNEKQASSPTATNELNASLLFNPDSPKAALSGSLEMNSFVEEARFRGPPRSAAVARAWEASFARPAVLATAGTVAENAWTAIAPNNLAAILDGSDSAVLPASASILPERVEYIAARRIAGSCLRAFVDCTEALELLHTAEVATLAAAKALPSPLPASLAQVANCIERDAFVSGALTLCPSGNGLVDAWASVSSEINQIARAKRTKASDLYSRLHTTHRLLAKFYEEVEQVKRRASILAKTHEENVNHAWKSLLVAWERLIMQSE